jgi:hypothetical protein
VAATDLRVDDPKKDVRTLQRSRSSTDVFHQPAPIGRGRIITEEDIMKG